MSQGISTKPIHILIAEDDPEDRMLMQEAIFESKLRNPVHFVENGEQLLDYLHHREAYFDAGQHPLPGLILLDLNMPRKDGREVLRELKATAAFRRIPIIVFTTSKDDEDILQSYDLGVNSYITKPSNFSQMVNVVCMLRQYWLETVELP
ncbi:MAG: response regulator [Bacteroidia bacterium]